MLVTVNLRLTTLIKKTPTLTNSQYRDVYYHDTFSLPKKTKTLTYENKNASDPCRTGNYTMYV